MKVQYEDGENLNFPFIPRLTGEQNLQSIQLSRSFVLKPRASSNLSLHVSNSLLTYFDTALNKSVRKRILPYVQCGNNNLPPDLPTLNNRLEETTQRISPDAFNTPEVSKIEYQIPPLRIKRKSPVPVDYRCTKTTEDCLLKKSRTDFHEFGNVNLFHKYSRSLSQKCDQGLQMRETRVDKVNSKMIIPSKLLLPML